MNANANVSGSSNRWQAFAGARWATLLLTLNAVFSVVMLTAMVMFVDDVASTLAIYFELSSADKWQIIGKFSTPILVAIASLLIFNATATLVCLYYSLATHNYFDSLVKNVNLILIGEKPAHPVKAFSPQTKTLASKLTQLQDRVAIAQASPSLADNSPPTTNNDKVDDAS